MDNQQPSYNPPPPAPTNKPKPPVLTEDQIQGLLILNHVAGDTKKAASPKKRFAYITLAIVVIIILVITSYHTHEGNKSHKSASSGSGNILTNPGQNPLNNNGSVNSQVKYCSNPINASLAC